MNDHQRSRFFSGTPSSRSAPRCIDQFMSLTACEAPGPGRKKKLCHADIVYRTPEKPAQTAVARLHKVKQHRIVHRYTFCLVLHSEQCSLLSAKVCLQQFNGAIPLGTIRGGLLNSSNRMASASRTSLPARPPIVRVRTFCSTSCLHTKLTSHLPHGHTERIPPLGIAASGGMPHRTNPVRWAISRRFHRQAS